MTPHLTKAEFLSQLESRLTALPANERKNALDYYDSYLSNVEDPGALSQKIANLGTPGDVAAEIFASYVKRGNQIPPQPAMPSTPTMSSMPTAHPVKRSGLPWWLIVILAVFALPLIIGLGGGLFGILVGIGASVLAFVVSGFAMLATGVASIVLAIPVLFQDTGFGFLVAGAGLVLLGLGILFFKLAAIICSGIFYLIQIAIRRLRHGRA